MHPKRQFVYGMPAFLVILSLVWNEHWSYYYLSNQWPVHKEDKESICHRILIIADPQLIGYENEKFGEIARWDSDRYLSKGYQYAKAHYNPTMEIYMGDLFDEGLESNEDQWMQTYERFMSIFPNDSNISRIFIAGDNDIGGEDFEPIDENVKNRFYNYFRSSLSNQFEEFYKIYETFLFDLKSNQRMITKKSNKDKLATMMLTHVPYLKAQFNYNKIGHEADLILSAHDHTTGIYEISRASPQALTYTRVNDFSPVYVKRIGHDVSLVEIQTPTCSYRMGVASMGYGGLTVCRSEYGEVEIQYSVYWMPARYFQLYFYVIVIIFSLSWIFYYKCYRRRRYSWLN